MICKESPGLLKIQSTDGTHQVTVDWQGPLYVFYAKLHPTGGVLAAIGSRNPEIRDEHGLRGFGDLRVFLADLLNESVEELAELIGMHEVRLIASD